MSAAFATIGAVADGSTALTVDWPASLAAGRLIVLASLNKSPPDVPVTPSSPAFSLQTMLSAGEGSDATSDQGEVNAALFTRESDGSESGTLSFSVPDASVTQAVMLSFTKGSGESWALAYASGSQDTASTSWSVVLGSDPGFIAGDIALLVQGVNSNTPTSVNTRALAVPGCTVSAATERVFAVTGTGRDQCLHVCEFAVTAGASSGAATYTANVPPSATAFAPTGPVLLLRVRAVAVATGTTLTGPSSGVVGVPSSNFTVGVTPTGGTISGTLTVTPGDASDGGTFTPTSVELTTASPTGTFSYTPDDAGTKTISITDDGGLADASSVSYVSLPPPELSGAITASDAAASGNLSTGASLLTGDVTTADAAPTGTLGLQFSTVASLPFTRNPGNGGRLVNLPNIAVAVLSDEANLVRLNGSTGLLMAGDGRVTFANGVPVPPGSSVILLTREPGLNGALGVDRRITT